MMSYLWILLLGSLLAASAKAQDDVDPTAEAIETTESPPEEVTTEEEATVEEEHEHSSEETPTEPEPETTEDPDPAADIDATEATIEATTEAEEETLAEEDSVTEAVEEEEEAVTTVAADTEEEAAATTAAVPAADPETQEPEAVEPESKEEDDEDKPAKTNTTTPAPKIAADPDAEDSEEEATDPVVPVPTIKPNVAAPEVNTDLGFNLEDALAEGPAVENPAQSGKSHSVDPKPRSAGATGDVDKPEAQESGSSSLAGILSAVVIAAVGGVAAYVTYQKKKLCFKNRQEADPEAARKADAAEAQSDPQVLSNLLNSS